MLIIRIMLLKHLPVQPKFESSEPQEGAVMPLVSIDISKTASRERVRDVGDACTAGEWTAAEASTLPSPTDARS
jgi:hypothetical protein